LPYDSLNLLLFAEGAAAFEELTSATRDQLKVRLRRLANFFVRRFLSRRFVQSDVPPQSREEWPLFSEVDLLLVPSLRDEIARDQQQYGHPRSHARGFVEVSEADRLGPDKILSKIFPPRRFPRHHLIGRLF